MIDRIRGAMRAAGATLLRANRAPAAPPLWKLRAHAEGSIRRENYRGKEHIVVPIVALVEGVIQCSTCPEPELALATEFGKVVESWNGRPVTIPHPNVNGIPVAAGSTAMMQSFSVGWVFNTRLEGQKLHLEAWVDPEMAANVSEGPKLIERIEALEAGTSDEQIEVSTGYFTETVPHQGRYNGVAYAAIQRDVKPDHLAILRESEPGACSWDDGCGVRANLVAACACGGACGASTEKAEHEQLAELRRRVQESESRAIANAVPRDGQSRANATGTSFEDLRRAVTLALFDDLDGDLYVVNAVFADAVIYERWSSLDMWERPWRMAGDQVELGEGEFKVRPETRFIPITPRDNTRTEETMTKKERVNALIANAATRFEESDRVWLEALAEDQLGKLEPEGGGEPGEGAEPTSEPASEPASEPGEGEDLEGAPTDAEPTKEQVQAAAKKLGLEVLEPTTAEREVQEEALALHAQRKGELVKALSELTDSPYEKAELEKMPLRDLQRLAKLAKVEPKANAPDFSGRGMPARTGDESADPLGDQPRSLAQQVGTRASRANGSAQQ